MSASEAAVNATLRLEGASIIFARSAFSRLQKRSLCAKRGRDATESSRFLNIIRKLQCSAVFENEGDAPTDRNARAAMPSRHNCSLRSVITIALACIYLFFAASASLGWAHDRHGSPCHGHDIAISGLSYSGDFAAHDHSDSDTTQSDDGGTAGHADSVCQFCSAIVSDAEPIAPRLIMISAEFTDCGFSFFGQPPARLPRPPQAFIAL